MIVNVMDANIEENIAINVKQDLPQVEVSPNKFYSDSEHDNMVEKAIEVIYNHFSSGLRMIGPVFALAMILFILTVVESFFTMLLPYWKNKCGILFAIFITILCIVILFNILFNYLLAVLVRPGRVEDVKKSKFFREKRNPYVFNEEVNQAVDFSYIFENNNINTNTLSTTTAEGSKKEYIPPKFKFCSYCKETKPLRAHHCQICGYCVFKMDHHCPWVNNCIGQNNHRYFVLFLFHTLVGCIFISILSSPIFFFHPVKSLPVRFNFISILCLTGCILLIFFNSFNWFLVLNGNTTIEYWTSQNGMSNANYIIKNFNLFTIRENIFMVFGTKNILEAVFVPSIKKLPYSGLEWSRICDPQYKVSGVEEIVCRESINIEALENDLLKDIEI